MSTINIPEKLLHNLLNETDDFAVKTVTEGRGGPFGASIHVYDMKIGEVTQIGEVEANAVLLTGMGSAHAEDQALNPETIDALKGYLRGLETTEGCCVVMSSSGQSCPACHSKQEILARDLIEEGLIKEGQFVVTYGATYKDTADIAGFNDAPYHVDMQKSRADRMIDHQDQGVADIPQAVADIFEKSDQAVAVIAMPDGMLIEGGDNRAHDMMATPEVSAIRNAARIQKSNGAQTPWDLGKATLYTSTKTPGPLGYAECQWANVTQWVSVDHDRADMWATQEAKGIENDRFFNVIAAQNYNLSGATLYVKRLEPFENKAQHTWKRKLESEADPDSLLYNGIDCD